MTSRNFIKQGSKTRYVLHFGSKNGFSRAFWKEKWRHARVLERRRGFRALTSCKNASPERGGGRYTVWVGMAGYGWVWPGMGGYVPPLLGRVRPSPFKSLVPAFRDAFRPIKYDVFFTSAFSVVSATSILPHKIHIRTPLPEIFPIPGVPLTPSNTMYSSLRHFQSF